MLDVKDLRIVVIDDNLDAADVFTWLLEAEGYKAEAAYSAAAGLELFAKVKPHVIFCDLGMPGMSGYDFAQKLRTLEKPSDPLLVAVSGWGDERTRMRTKNAGFNAYLVKPAHLSTIKEILADHLNNISKPTVVSLGPATSAQEAAFTTP